MWAHILLNDFLLILQEELILVTLSHLVLSLDSMVTKYL